METLREFRKNVNTSQRLLAENLKARRFFEVMRALPMTLM